jgi:hypothetical protein
MPNNYPLQTTGGGPPTMFAGYTYESSILLTGNLTAHYGTIVGAACRIVADPESPLRFAAIGDCRYTKRETAKLDATERWVMLTGDHDALRAAARLFGENVRIEYGAPNDR